MCAVSAQARSFAEYTSRSVDDVSAFTSVDVRGDAEVDFVQRAETSVTLSGRDKWVNAAQVRVEKDTLVVSFSEPMFGRDKDKLRVLVSAPELAAVTVSQNAEFDVRGPLRAQTLALTALQHGEISIDDLETETLTATASGHAEIDVKRLTADTVRAVVSNHAEIELAGTAQKAFLENNGSGDIDAGDLRAVSADAAVNGSGDVEIFAEQTLNAAARGRGKIEYKGVPARINPTGKTGKVLRDF